MFLLRNNFYNVAKFIKKSVPSYCNCNQTYFLIFILVSRLDARAMSPAQSEDSGLAADRGSTYATISIPRQNCQSMGIIFAGKINVAHVPRRRRLHAPRRMFVFLKIPPALKTTIFVTYH